MAENKPKTYAEIRAARDGNRPTNGALLSDKPQKKKESWIRSLIIAGLIAFVLRTFFLEAFRIPTGSMKNTLLVGDHLFVNKIGHFIQSPKYIPFTEIEIPHIHWKVLGVHRGDVTVFEYPGDRDLVVPREKKVNYIKRCIGEPGDVVQIVNKQVYVNGKIFPNPAESILSYDTMKAGFVDPNIFPRGAQWNRDNWGPLRIPKEGDTLFLTKETIDRWQVFIEREGHKVEMGPSDQILVDGKPTLQYKVQRDYLWMMGDNRDDSEDSRFWGFCPVDNVVGEGLIIYWSWYNPPSSGTGDGYDPDEAQNTHIRWGRIGRLIH